MTAPETTERSPLEGLSYADVRRIISRWMWEQGEFYGGAPIPVEGLGLTVEPTFAKAYPGLEAIAARGRARPPEGEVRIHVDTVENTEPDEYIVNEWFCRRWSARVVVTRSAKDGRGRCYLEPEQPEYKKISYMANSLAACSVHDLGAEYTAMTKLKGHLTEFQYAQYELLGYFGEASPRSNVLYIFRRARPTVALSKRSGKFLCALCMHPIAYYNESFVGAMTPTDDLLAHLLLMRADEHFFWRRCNQHPYTMANAGI
jgi:hypothetical protein